MLLSKLVRTDMVLSQGADVDPCEVDPRAYVTLIRHDVDDGDRISYGCVACMTAACMRKKGTYDTWLHRMGIVVGKHDDCEQEAKHTVDQEVVHLPETEWFSDSAPQRCQQRVFQGVCNCRIFTLCSLHCVQTYCAPL